MSPSVSPTAGWFDWSATYDIDPARITPALLERCLDLAAAYGAEARTLVADLNAAADPATKLRELTESFRRVDDQCEAAEADRRRRQQEAALVARFGGTAGALIYGADGKAAAVTPAAVEAARLRAAEHEQRLVFDQMAYRICVGAGLERKGALG